ncbi:MAG: lyase family protein [Patescibacteria group bacterium]|jgi:adenylosuccinate lyase
MNETLPGHSRYQPKELVPIFGYDHSYEGVARVEIANLEVLGEIGFIPADDIALLTPDVREQLLGITTTEVDQRERKVTKHDIRAWVQLAMERVDRRLGRWIHTGLTSYDPLDTARAMSFVRAHREAVRPAASEVGLLLSDLVERFADQLQLGRTHLQAALPITVGFWLATILSRYLYTLEEMDRACGQIVGKISGAVGAFNAQKGLGILAKCGGCSFEYRVLAKLGLQPARISTQILPPEPLALHLFVNCLFSASMAQLGQDARNLMRTEIAEFAEVKGLGEVGSSTLGQKTNPINFENMVGIWILTKNMFGNVMDTLISDLQRDLVGSPVARFFPVIVVNVMQQLNTLRRRNDDGVPFLARVVVNADACERNFRLVAPFLLAEPTQLALQIAGFEGDGYKIVAEQAVPESKRTGRLLIDILEDMPNEALLDAIGRIPPSIMELLHRPEEYTGLAFEKAQQVARLARRQLVA